LTLVYDDSGNIVEENYEYDDTKHITKFKIEKGKMVSSITYDKEGKKSGTSDYFFEGDLIKEIVSKDGKHPIKHIL